MSKSAAELIATLEEARERTLGLVADLDDDQLMGPRLAIVNPFLWEIGHVAWFQEKWSLRHLRGLAPLEDQADSLYDSMAIDHDTRWDLPLFTREGTLVYMRQVLDCVVEHLAAAPAELSPDEVYFHLLPLFHEDMHGEAFAYTRQTHGYPAPAVYGPAKSLPPAGPLPGDVEVPGGTFPLGAARDAPFAFDNEKWAHPVEIATFRIGRAPVTQGELRNFVEDGGYERRELWSDAGWEWLAGEAVRGPLYWRRHGGGRFERRIFDRWVELEEHLPALHVNWHEAQAWCRWASRRLPTEAEWEMAACGLGADGSKCTYPWGAEDDCEGRANLDGRSGGTVDVGALGAGDSPFGCRQMLGNVWEWTADDFGPFPGFVPDPYKEYSEPWFGDHKILRGGCWVTRFRMLRNTWRNFYQPHRRDVWAGFRTCA